MSDNNNISKNKADKRIEESKHEQQRTKDKQRKRKSRWGAAAEGSDDKGHRSGSEERGSKTKAARKSRFDTAPSAMVVGPGGTAPAIRLDAAQIAAAAAAARLAKERAQAVAQQQKSALQLQSEQLNALRHGRIAAEAAARAVAQAEAMQLKGFSSGPVGGISAPVALRLDQYGREIDADGKLIPMSQLRRPASLSTLKINQNRAALDNMRKHKHKVEETAAAAAAAAGGAKLGSIAAAAGKTRSGATRDRFFDPSVHVAGAVRRPRMGFNFNDSGTWTKKEIEMQKQQGVKVASSMVESKEEDNNKTEDGIVGNNNKAAISLGVTVKIHPRDAPPVTEWWDQIVVDAGGPDRVISSYVEHPPPAKSAAQPHKQEGMAALTPAERKKLRRLKRKEKATTMQDKIRMGLLPPPPPKVRMKNLMMVLGDEAVQDPTAVEKRVRAEVAARRDAHDKRNEERKLPPEEKKLKKAGKWINAPETETQVHVSVYKVKDLTSKRHQFKVSKNAEQLHVSGMGIIAGPEVGNVIIVEGSRKAVRRYDKLMLRRINWNERIGNRRRPGEEEEEDQTAAAAAVEEEYSDYDSDTEDVTSRHSDGCVRMWHGVIPKRLFPMERSGQPSWKIVQVPGESFARRTLREYHAEHYWDMLARFRDKSIDV
ncbi:U4/U6-U5 snRNP complex subunit prp3 [Perkinsus chesapeaki]|uniref:U4/U6-U5 snRNP complex subunit prp3 n=1 Tax=Perkinsus chesapeaki TaxID=330153 RepID=A0A7J6LV29_PERCH|nr:U4/U6-U5 snRNP complex subunit prp3 [Perkinsus chesapeaki]